MAKHKQDLANYWAGSPMEGELSQVDSLYRHATPEIKEVIVEALEQAVEEIELPEIEEPEVEEVVPEEEEEVVEEPIEVPEPVDIQVLTAELREVLVEGFKEVIKASMNSGKIEKLLSEQTSAIKELNIVQPTSMFNPQATPRNPPIKRLRAVNIVRDVNGDVVNAEFEVER